MWLNYFSMCLRLFSLVLLFPVALFASDVQSDSCLQCMSTINVAHDGCQHCAQYVQKMMSSSNLERLSSLMSSLKKSAYKNCGEHGLLSKACQVYHALCQDDHACDHELLSRLSELKDASGTAVDSVVV